MDMARGNTDRGLRDALAPKKARRAKKGRATAPRQRRAGVFGRLLRLTLLVAVLVPAGYLVALRWVAPPTTPYILSEGARLGAVERRWVPLQAIAPEMRRAAVAAEDANFCLHGGFDMDAIRDAIAEGGNRGASTITQQTVKNVFLWQGRSWPRKALEAVLTPVVEVVWSKRRILELYLNVAEFGEGVFGVEAAARHHFGVSARDLTGEQAARLAVLLPNPKARDPNALGRSLQRRAASVRDGAATIRVDGRASCF